MNCPVCHGKGIFSFGGYERVGAGDWMKSTMNIPCLECGGLGQIHCCDGLHEQPEPESDIEE
jgi:hypothetical protein